MNNIIESFVLLPNFGSIGSVLAGANQHLESILDLHMELTHITNLGQLKRKAVDNEKERGQWNSPKKDLINDTYVLTIICLVL